MRGWCLCLVALVAISVSAPAQDDSHTVTTKIVAMEKAWNQAFKLRDTKALDSLLADGMVLVNDDGSLQSKEAFIKFVHDSKPSEDEQVTPESIDVRIVGDVAIATGIFRSKGMENGRAYQRQDRFVDTWIRRGGSWVSASASATRMMR